MFIKCIWSIIFDTLFNMISKEWDIGNQVNLGCTSPVSVRLEQLLTIYKLFLLFVYKNHHRFYSKKTCELKPDLDV